MEHVVITGGSSGIGAAVAARCLARGDRVTLIARDGARLAKAASALAAASGGDASARIRTAIADVADRRAVETAAAEAQSAFGACNLLVVSAGIVLPDRFDTQPAELFDSQIHTNLLGAANAVRAVYPAMRERRSGRILLIGSGAALIGIVGYAGYGASKAGLHGFAETLRAEARRDGISVTICHPPDTDTPQLAVERDARPAEAEIVMGRGGTWSADSIAALALDGVAGNRFAIYPGLPLTLLGLFGSTAMPVLRRIFDWRIARLSKRPDDR